METLHSPALDKLLVVFNYLIHPEFPKISVEIPKGSNYSLERIQRYNKLLMGVNWFLKKIGRYEYYFLNFYPSQTSISDAEALEHHVHAYLEDLQTLREKLIIFLNSVKNDIKKTAPSKDAVEKQFALVTEKIFNSFGEVSENRNPHRHNGYIFVVEQVVDAEQATMFLEQPEFKEGLSEEGIIFFEEKRKVAIADGKRVYAEMAKRNSEGIQKLCEAIFSSIPGVYIAMDIKKEDAEKILP